MKKVERTKWGVRKYRIRYFFEEGRLASPNRFVGECFQLPLAATLQSHSQGRSHSCSQSWQPSQRAEHKLLSFGFFLETGGSRGCIHGLELVFVAVDQTDDVPEGNLVAVS